MINETAKKKNFSRKNKRDWRKHISTKDVDDFLDEKRHEERIGGPVKNRADKDLFVLDSAANKDCLIADARKLTKKERAKLPLKCFELLKPLTAVPDPIVKRNRVRTREERMCPIRKKIESYKRSLGIVPRKVVEARKQRLLTLKKKKEQPVKQEFKNDIWANGEEDMSLASEWLTEETVRHTKTNLNMFKVKVPKSVREKKSVLPAIENPHPGTSYNPEYKEHQNLLKIVIDKETELLKQEEHIKRVTTDSFNKVPSSERDKMLWENMSEGLFDAGVKDETEEGDYKPINLPVNRADRKTIRQKKRDKEDRKNFILKREEKINKKKLSDIYKLRFINQKLDNDEKFHLKKRAKRSELAAKNVGKTKRIGPKAFEEPDEVFSRSHELSGNLRALKRQGNLLSDRFYSLQKRNILPPTNKQIGSKKRKTKKFVKPSHKDETVK